MGHVVSLDAINQFLPATKLQLADHGQYEADKLEESARSIVKSRLSAVYNTSTWTGKGSFPKLVESIIGMFVAGWVYNKQFSDESVDDSYGERRLREARDLLDGIVMGHYDLDDATVVSPDAGRPSVEETEPIFEMGRAF